MNWLEFLELASVLLNHHQVNWFLPLPLGLSLKRKSPISKYQHKWDKKISAQSSQIKNLHTKLDGAIAKNIQIRELLNPATLQTAFTNALQVTQFQSTRPGKFLGKVREPVMAAGKDGTTDPEKSCNYCKDTGHDVDNCLHLQK